MSLWFKWSYRLVLGTALGITGGCAGKSPEWLTAPSGAFCATGLNDVCLKALAEKSYVDATAKEVAIQKSSNLPSPDPKKVPVNQAPGKDGQVAGPNVSASSVSPPTQATGLANPEAPSDHPPEATAAKLMTALPALPEMPLTTGVEDLAQQTKDEIKGGTTEQGAASVTKHEGLKLTNDSIPSLAFGISAIGAKAKEADGFVPPEQVVESKQAGRLLNIGAGPVPNALIEEATRIGDKALRADTLSGMVTLHSGSMTEDQINRVLNELYSLDEGQYANALIVKLPVLLKIGDLERAKALRAMLLNSPATKDRPFSMLAFVATCYTMAGMKQDAGDIVQDAIRDGGELTTDDLKLIQVSVIVANGSYPMMQEFYDFETDNARLSAYLTIAVVARQLGMPGIAHRAISDAVRFVQKSAVKVDRQKALSQILSVSPGIM